MSLEETDSGNIGRWSPTKMRFDGMRFESADEAAKARTQITNGDPADCIVMSSPAARGGDYTRVLVGPIEEPRNSRDRS